MTDGVGLDPVDPLELAAGIFSDEELGAYRAAGYSGNDAVRNNLGIWSFGTVSPPRTWGLEVQYDF